MYTKASDTVTSQHNYGDLEKIAIIGCGYVGTALSKYWYQQQSRSIIATTTRQERVKELEEVTERGRQRSRAIALTKSRYCGVVHCSH
ncbi:NAD(P)-binding domain-containing protein [Brunnivagina elsteri]|uniref:NAD(P)-binding domain-containing protein n=1 Tax=Brunnivagina elsteri TaxID=1247191 RepID=UPI002695E2C2